MPDKPWRPASEAEAVGAATVFLEWLGAVHGLRLAGPTALAEWRRGAAAAFAAAISDFAGLGGHGNVREALLHGHGERAALIMPAPDGGRLVWSRADLLRVDPLPPDAEKMLAALTPADLPALAASHLLDAGTTPDGCLAWAGAASEPWPLGAWLVGACVRLGASEDGALRAAPRWRGTIGQAASFMSG